MRLPRLLGCSAISICSWSPAVWICSIPGKQSNPSSTNLSNSGFFSRPSAMTACGILFAIDMIPSIMFCFLDWWGRLRWMIDWPRWHRYPGYENCWCLWTPPRNHRWKFSRHGSASVDWLRIASHLPETLSVISSARWWAEGDAFADDLDHLTSKINLKQVVMEILIVRYPG